MATNKREELVAHLNRGRELLSILKDPAHRRTITALVDYLERKLAAMDKGGTPQMGAHGETLLEMERRHIREGTERIARQKAIIARLGDGNRSDTANLAREILATMCSSLNLAKQRLRQIEEQSKK